MKTHKERALEHVAKIRHILQLAPDEAIVAEPTLCPAWKAGETYGKNTALRHGDGLYRVVQDGTIAQEHQPPDGAGMLAVYRPIERSATGAKDDPIPWVYGMDCTATLYYTYNGKLYRCMGDMIPCIWRPDSGIWQWDAVE